MTTTTDIPLVGCYCHLPIPANESNSFACHLCKNRRCLACVRVSCFDAHLYAFVLATQANPAYPAQKVCVDCVVRCGRCKRACTRTCTAKCQTCLAPYCAHCDGDMSRRLRELRGQCIRCHIDDQQRAEQREEEDREWRSEWPKFKLEIATEPAARQNAQQTAVRVEQVG